MITISFGRNGFLDIDAEVHFNRDCSLERAELPIVGLSHRIGNRFSRRSSARTRAVKFSEKDGLPPAEGEFPLLDPNRFRGTDQSCFNVRIRIPFLVLVTARVRDQAVESYFDIARDVGVIAFVDQGASSPCEERKGRRERPLVPGLTHARSAEFHR